MSPHSATSARRRSELETNRRTRPSAAYTSAATARVAARSGSSVIASRSPLRSSTSAPRIRSARSPARSATRTLTCQPAIRRSYSQPPADATTSATLDATTVISCRSTVLARARARATECRAVGLRRHSGSNLDERVSGLRHPSVTLLREYVKVRFRRHSLDCSLMAVSVVRSGRISASWVNDAISSPSSVCTAPRT